MTAGRALSLTVRGGGNGGWFDGLRRAGTFSGGRSLRGWRRAGGGARLFADPKPYSFDRVVRILLTALVVAVLGWVVVRVREVLVPLAVGFLLAYLLNPVVNFVQRKVRNRAAAVLLTVGAAVVLLAAALAVVLPAVGREVASTGETLVATIRENSRLVEWARARLPADLSREIERVTNSAEFRAYLDSAEFRELMQSAQSAGGALVQGMRWALTQVWGIGSGLYAVVLGVTGLFLVLLYMVFLLIDYKLIAERWREYLPPAYREDIVDFLREFNAAMSTYFRGQFIVASIVGVLLAVGFKIIGLKLGILLGLLIGALNMVPYLQTIGVIPAVLMAVLTAFDRGGSVMWYLAGVVLVLAVVQVLQDAVISPRIMGQATGLRPVVLLFSVLFWGKLLGFLGLVMEIRLACLGLAYYRRLLAKQGRDQSKIATST